VRRVVRDAYKPTRVADTKSLGPLITRDRTQRFGACRRLLARDFDNPDGGREITPVVHSGTLQTRMAANEKKRADHATRGDAQGLTAVRPSAVLDVRLVSMRGQGNRPGLK